MPNALAIEVKFTPDSMVEACYQLALQVRGKADDYDRFELTTANIEFNPDPLQCVYAVRALRVYCEKMIAERPAVHKDEYSEFLKAYMEIK